jgi:AcrR family transcriptional regulator
MKSWCLSGALSIWRDLSATGKQSMPEMLSECELTAFRQRVCEEAERQFVHTGVEAFTMRSLAKALGCSPTTPYTYFRNKDEILAAVRASILMRLSRRLEQSECDDPKAWARAHHKAFVDFAFDEPACYRLAFDLYQDEDIDSDELAEANVRIARVGVDYVQKLIEAEVLVGDPQDLAYLFFAFLHGLIVLRMTGHPPSTRLEFDRQCRKYLSLMAKGMKGPRLTLVRSDRRKT